MDRTTLDEGEFRTQGGGFERLNKKFDGKLGEILAELQGELWESSG